MDDGFQSPEELDVRFADDGPVRAAERWLKLCVIEGNLIDAWPLMHEELKRKAVSAWINANRHHPVVAAHDPDQLLDALTGPIDNVPAEAWVGFQVTQVRELRETWARYVEHPEHYGAASRARLVPPDSDLVMLIDTGGQVMLAETPTVVEDPICILMRFTGTDWVVADVGGSAYDRYVGTAPPDIVPPAN